MTVNAVPYVIQALSHPADNFRRALRFATINEQGVSPNDFWQGANALIVQQNGSPNMSVNVATGEALIKGTQNLTTQGSYHLINDATVNLTIAASDPTNPRIDIVCAAIQDAAYSGASNQALLQVVTGTPAPSPSPPATPANAIVLAQVAVAANATSIVSGNITDTRPNVSSIHVLNGPSNLPPLSLLRIQSGRVTWSETGGNSQSGTLTFPTPFAASTTPLVLLTVEIGSNLDFNINITGPTTNTSFGWRVFQNTNTNTTASGAFHWLAIGQ